MGVIIRANAGHDLPVSYLEAACKANQTFWSLSFPQDGVLASELVSEQPTAELVSENQKAFKENTCLLHLGSAPSGYPADIQQPFTLLRVSDETSDAILVGFLDGDFKSYEDKAQPLMTGEALCVKKYLKPKLEKLYRLCGNDVAKLVEEINTDDFETDMDRCYGIHGTIVLLFASGECFEFAKNENQETYDWGWTSQSYGWKAEAAKPAPAKATTLSLLKKAVADKKATAAEPPPKDNVVPLKVPTETPEPAFDQPPPGRDKTNSTLMKPPKNITKNKIRKLWYKCFGGYLPNNWQTLPAVWVLNKDAVAAGSGRLVKPDPMRPEDLGKAVTDGTLALHPNAGSAGEDDDDDEDADDATTTTAGVDANNEAAEAAADNAISTPLHEKLPVIDPKEIISFRGFMVSDAGFKGLVKAHEKQIGDPAKFADLESKITELDFAKALGMKGPEETLSWTPLMWHHVIKTWPTIGKAALMYFLRRCVELEKEIDELEVKVKSAGPTTTTVKETPPIVPETPVAPVTGKRRLLNTARRVPG